MNDWIDYLLIFLFFLVIVAALQEPKVEAWSLNHTVHNVSITMIPVPHQ